MSKKVRLSLSVVLVFAFLSGVVSAASVNGEYKGNPIVKVYVNGQEIRSEVPAHIVDGSTLLPMRAVAEALGAEIKWNPDTYTVDIQKTTEAKGLSVSDLNLFVSAAKRQLKNIGINLIFYSINIDETGAYVSVGYDSGTKTQDQILNDLVLVSASSALMKGVVDETVISVSGGGYLAGTIYVPISASQDFADQKINLSEYISRWTVKKNDALPNWQTNVLPNINQSVPSYQNQPSLITCSQINSKYDQIKRQKQEELASRGLSRSSIYNFEIEKIEELRKIELQAYGCPTS